MGFQELEGLFSYLSRVRNKFHTSLVSGTMNGQDDLPKNATRPEMEAKILAFLGSMRGNDEQREMLMQLIVGNQQDPHFSVQRLHNLDPKVIIERARDANPLPDSGLKEYISWFHICIRGKRERQAPEGFPQPGEGCNQVWTNTRILLFMIQEEYQLQARLSGYDGTEDMFYFLCNMIFHEHTPVLSFAEDSMFWLHRQFHPLLQALKNCNKSHWGGEFNQEAFDINDYANATLGDIIRRGIR